MLKLCNHRVFFTWLLTVSYLGFLRGAAATPPLYLGMVDNASTVPSLANYAADTDVLTQIKSPFPQYAFLSYAPDGTLYGTQGSELFTVDSATGEGTSVGTLTCDWSPVVCSGLTFKPDGTLYVHEYSKRTGVWAHRLYSNDGPIDNLTFVATITGASGLYGIEYAGTTLYGSYDHAFYSISTTTGAASLIGTGTSAWDLDFNTDGTMRGAFPAGGLFSIALDTGVSTSIRDFRPDNETWGLATFRHTCFSVSGNIVLQDYAGNGPAVPIPVELRKQGGDDTTHTIYLDSNGNYTMANLEAGTYDIGFEPSHWLRRVVSGVVVADADVTGVNASLINGDANGDNQVSFEDFAMLQNHYGHSVIPDTNGDFNGDGLVTFEDFAILQNAYGRSGDSFGGGDSLNFTMGNNLDTETIEPPLITLQFIDLGEENGGYALVAGVSGNCCDDYSGTAGEPVQGLATFKVTLEDGTYDNASAGVVAPWASFRKTAAPHLHTIRNCGFTFMAGVNDNTTLGQTAFTGSQDTVTAQGVYSSPILAYGIGQEAGDLTDLCPSGYEVYIGDLTVYDCPVVIASGLGATAPTILIGTRLDNLTSMVEDQVYSSQCGVLGNVLQTTGTGATEPANVKLIASP